MATTSPTPNLDAPSLGGLDPWMLRSEVWWRLYAEGEEAKAIASSRFAFCTECSRGTCRRWRPDNGRSPS